VTRHLEALVANRAPWAAPLTAPERAEIDHETKEEYKERDDKVEELRPLSMIFICQPKPSQSVAYAHLPTLVHLSTFGAFSNTASAASSIATRLVPLAVSADARLASCLGIPRVGAIAVFGGAPGVKALEAFVKQKVGFAECKWIDEAIRAEWKGANVKDEEAARKQSKRNGTNVNSRARGVEAGKEI
jgi:ribonuclease P/MRP protein subunit POP3